MPLVMPQIPTKDQLEKFHRITISETNRALAIERYPSLDKWSNGAIKTFFGKCSTQHHRLIVLLQNHRSLDEWVEGWKAIPCGKQGCRPFDTFFAQGHRRGYSKTLKGTCTYCGESLSMIFKSSRLLAVLKLQPGNLWKAVITRRCGRTKYLYEGSARCNLYCHPNHCMTPLHLNLETHLHNTRRKRHHAGISACDCKKRCVGSMTWRQRHGTTKQDRKLPLSVRDRNKPLLAVEDALPGRTFHQRTPSMSSSHSRHQPLTVAAALQKLSRRSQRQPLDHATSEGPPYARPEGRKL